MAGDPVGMHEAFRPWYEAGVTHLLPDAAYWEQRTQDQAAGPTPAGATSSLANAHEQQADNARQAASGPDDAPRQTRPQSPSHSPSRATSHAPGKPPVGAAGQASSLVPPQTSPVWKLYWSMVQWPAATMWTYWELGVDMGASLGAVPDPARKELLGKFITHLAWPKGSVAFFPVAGLEAGELVARPRYFRTAAERANATGVACFGGRAWQAMGGGADTRYGLKPWQGLTVALVPDLAEIATDPEAKRQAWLILKQLGEISVTS